MSMKTLGGCELVVCMKTLATTTVLLVVCMKTGDQPTIRRQMYEDCGICWRREYVVVTGYGVVM
jgi:hypothetical protein